MNTLIIGLAILSEHLRSFYWKESYKVYFFNFCKFLLDKVNLKKNKALIFWLTVSCTVTFFVMFLEYLVFNISYILFFIMQLFFIYFFIQFKNILSDLQTIKDHFKKNRNKKFSENLIIFNDINEKMESKEILTSVLNKIFILIHEKFYGIVIYYFVLPGLSGVTLYICSSSLKEFSRLYNKDKNFNNVIQKLFNLIDYIPSRISCICLAISGNFQQSLKIHKKSGYFLINERINLINSNSVASVDQDSSFISINRKNITLKKNLTNDEAVSLIQSIHNMFWRVTFTLVLIMTFLITLI